MLEKFEEDVLCGEILEAKFASYWKEVSNNKSNFFKVKGNFHPFDLIHQYSIGPNIESETFEVKFDRLADGKYNNLFFEVFNPSTYKASGVASSKADFVVYITSKRRVFIFNKEKLLSDIKHHESASNIHVKYVSRAGDGNSNGYKCNIDYIISNFESLVEPPKELPNSLVETPLRVISVKDLSVLGYNTFGEKIKTPVSC